MRAVPLGTVACARPAEEVARRLIGTRLISTIGGVETVGRIVETEAYVGPHDAASHAAERFGRTARNATMFGPPGVAYVYRSYGIHWCLNVVTDQPGYPAAVLIRAIEPISGVDVMRARRGKRDADPIDGLGRGPGNLTVALGITGACDGHALDREPLLLVRGSRIRTDRIATSPRIGISRATDWPLRFYLKGHPCVSRSRAG